MKIGSKKVSEFIKQIERSKEESPVVEGQEEVAAPPMIPMADIRDHIKTHKAQMPTVTGPKAFSLAAPVVVDEPDIPDNSSHQMINQSGTKNTMIMQSMTKPNIFPKNDIKASDDLTDEELQPHFYYPSFMRPLPVPEGEDSDAEDFDDAYWLVPGMVPEPYWDINMGQEFNYAQLKYYVNKALRVQL